MTITLYGLGKILIKTKLQLPKTIIQQINIAIEAMILVINDKIRIGHHSQTDANVGFAHNPTPCMLSGGQALVAYL